MMKNDNSLPDIMSLNSGDLIEWMKKRKSEMGLSNAKLADLSGVPEGTIDRIMSKHYTEFRYSSIQPLMAILIGVRESIPEPDPTDNDQNEYYYNTIEGYKLALENKNHQIEELTRFCARQAMEIEFLKKEDSDKQKIIDRRAEHEKWLEDIVNELRAKCDELKHAKA